MFKTSEKEEKKNPLYHHYQRKNISRLFFLPSRLLDNFFFRKSETEDCLRCGDVFLCCNMRFFYVFGSVVMFENVECLRLYRSPKKLQATSMSMDSVRSELVRGWKVKVEQFIIRHFYGIFMFIVGKIFIQLISVRFFWEFFLLLRSPPPDRQKNASIAYRDD